MYVLACTSAVIKAFAEKGDIDVEKDIDFTMISPASITNMRLEIKQIIFKLIEDKQKK